MCFGGNLKGAKFFNSSDKTYNAQSVHSRENIEAVKKSHPAMDDDDETNFLSGKTNADMEKLVKEQNLSSKKCVSFSQDKREKGVDNKLTNKYNNDSSQCTSTIDKSIQNMEDNTNIAHLNKLSKQFGHGSINSMLTESEIEKQAKDVYGDLSISKF